MSETIAKILAEPQRREFQITRSTIDAEKRTVDLSFASEAPVERPFGSEILDCSERACDLTRLRTSGPLLVNHDPNDQVGVVDSCEMANAKGRAIVRFSKSARAQEIFQDVQDGIRTLVSVGYRVRKVEPVKRDSGGVDAYRVTEWEPLEISIVSIPADTSVGVGRSENQPQSPMKLNPPLHEATPAPDTRGGGTPAPAPATPVNVVEVEQRGANAERLRIKTVTELLDKYDCRDLTSQAISEGWQEDTVRKAIFERRVPQAKPLNEKERDPALGMSKGEIKRWSMVKAIREIALGKGLTGLELEASEAVAKKIDKRATGFFVPHDIAALGFAEQRDISSMQAELLAMQIQQMRALNAGSNTAGGYTVGTNLLSGSIIELLRNKTVINRLGARTLSGLVGNVAIPRISGGATAYWLSEVASVTASDQAFGQLILTPHRLAADTLYSKELVMQSSVDVEGLVRDDLTTVLAIEKDRVAINGLNAAGEPLGILNTSGLSTSVTFGAAATWAKVISFETNVATSNADLGALGYVSTPATRGKWKGISKFTNTGFPIWDGDMVNGYRALASNQIPSDKVIFGNWNDLIVAEWAGIDVVVDPYSAKKTGQIEVTMTLWTDVGVRHPVSFCISTDSGAQ